MVKAFYRFVQADLMAAWRNQDWMGYILHFVLMISLFPLAMGPEIITQPGLAAGVMWLAVIFTTTLASEHCLRKDLATGIFDQFVLSSRSFGVLVATKLFSIWLLSSLPLIVMTPFLWLIYQQSIQGLQVMLLTLLLGTPMITFLTSIATIVTYKAKRGATLLVLLVLPLVIPILILATMAVQAAEQSLAYSAHLLLLTGALLILAPLAPWSITASLRMVIYE